MERICFAHKIIIITIIIIIIIIIIVIIIIIIKSLFIVGYKISHTEKFTLIA